MKTFFIFLLISLVSSSALGQKPKTTIKGDADYAPLTVESISNSGVFENGVYKNAAIGFSVAIPENSNFPTKVENQQMLKPASDAIKLGKSKPDKTAIDQSIAKTRVLFTSPLSNSTTGSFAVAVEVGQTSITQKTYAEVNRNQLLGLFTSASIKNALFERSIDQITFSCFELEVPLATGGSYSQVFCVTKRKGTMFFFVATTLNEAEREAADKILNSIDLDI